MPFNEAPMDSYTFCYGYDEGCLRFLEDAIGDVNHPFHEDIKLSNRARRMVIKKLEEVINFNRFRPK